MRASPRTCLDLLDSCEGPVSSVFWLLGLSSIECGSSNYWSKCFEIIQAIFLFETSCDDSCFQFFRFLLLLSGFGGDIGGAEVLRCDLGVGTHCGDVGKFTIFGIRLQSVL
ncbi:uncharacterized protein [Physcomitrium patens]|uniref:uncharacterized protein isoform X1 n=1 Tax=Physcomitrium patens TaxID=3218 RepID=UPI003CCE3B1B